MKKLFSPIIFFTLLAGVYLVTRLINLTTLPIFNDEAMYLHWGQLIVQSPKDHWLVSLTDGQQPLYIWLMAISYWLSKSHFLLAGRVVSVLIGLGSILVFFKVGKELFDQKTGLLMAFLYVVLPFALWYDRLAIKDSLMLFWGSLLFFLSLRLVKTGKWRYAIKSGVVLGLALLTKSIAYFFVGLFPLTVIGLTFGKRVLRHWPQWVLKIGLTLGLAGLFQSLVYISPLAINIGSKHEVFLLSFPEILGRPIQLWRNNLYSTVMWWWQYFRLPILAMGAVGAGTLWLKKQFRVVLVLVGWILLPISFEILRAKIYIPRYFLFTLLPFLVLVASGINWCMKRLTSTWVQGALLGLVLFPSLLLDQQILFQLKQAQLPQVERWQYLEGWPAGYGLKELASWIKAQTQKEPVLLITEQETLVSSGLPLYLAKVEGWEIERRLPLDDNWGEFPSDLLAESRPVFLIVHHTQSVPSDWPVQQVTRIRRLNPDRFFLIYQVVSETE